MANKSLAEFLKERRLTIKKTQSALAKEMGVAYGVFGRWERMGELPRDLSKREKLAQLLETTLEEIIDSKNQIVRQEQTIEAGKTKNIMLLIKALAQCSCQSVTILDIEYLSGIQDKLPDKTLWPDIIEELLRHRIS